MTPDLLKLQKAKKLRAILDDIEVVFDDELEPLQLRGRAPSPSIAAHWAALRATDALCVWFGTFRGAAVGFWRGPKQTALESAPIVRFDTEGQYSIIGTTIADFIALAASRDEDDENSYGKPFAKVRKALVDAGFKVSASRDAIYATLPSRDDGPAKHYLQIYNAAKKAKPAKKPAAKQPAKKQPKR
jgi:hypothetical protein